MIWKLSHRADPLSVAIADRHYSRQKPGTPQFVPPGSCLVLRSLDDRAVWVTSWPQAEYVKHAWAGAWVNSFFRNESGSLASKMIRQAIAATRWFYGEPPALGIVTFIDRAKVRPIQRRSKPFWGYSYLQAGYTLLDQGTQGGLLVYQMLPEQMPAPEPPIGAQLEMMIGAT